MFRNPHARRQAGRFENLKMESPLDDTLISLRLARRPDGLK
jgi:hypothetical protein